MPITTSNSHLSGHIESAEVMRQGVMFLDREGNILAANERFAKELGYSKQQFEPKTIFQVNPHFNFIAWKKLWDELLAKGKLSLDTEHLTSNGGMVPAQLKGILLEAGGEMYCQFIVEGETSDSEEGLYLAQYCLDRIQEMIVWVNPNGSIFYANKVMRDTLDYQETDLSSLKISDIEPNLSEADRQEQWNKLKNCKKE